MKIIIAAAVLSLAAACLSGAVAGAMTRGNGDGETKPDIYTVSMNRICKEWDGQWQGMTVASDGNCYFSSSTHSKSHGAGFHKFDPRTYAHTMIAEDMTEVCGEGDLVSQQGKIHSPVVECDGWLYFTTHLSNYWKEGIENYPGAHVLGYELATGKFRDFGIIKPKYSVYSAIGVDPDRKKLYVFLVPFQPEIYSADGCHLYSVDIVSGEKKDLGRVVDGRLGASFWFYVDNNGNVWFTLWKRNYTYENDKGNLYVYRPDEDRIETYSDVLPEGKHIDGTPVGEKGNTQRCWTWIHPFRNREKCLFTMGSLGGGD